jgi:hypothetical protein
MTKDKTVTMSRELAEDRVRFEKWHNDFYGPQDKFNPIRSLAHDSFSVGLGYDDPTVQAQFCAFRGAIADPVVDRQDGSALMRIAADLANRRPLSRLQRICEGTGKISIENLSEDVDKCGDLLAGIALDIRRAITSPPAPVSVVLPDLSVIREYHLDATIRLDRYAADADMRKSDSEHYRKRAAFHRDQVATIDKLKELNQ